MSKTRKNRKSKVIVYHCVDKNLGDGINPIIFNELCKGFTFKDISKMPQDSDIPCILGIGSILSWNKDINSLNQIICGSGFIHENKVPQKPLKIISVRGVMTRDKFLDAGIDCPPIYGDLALLLRFIIPPVSCKKKYSFGIIPHYVDKDQPFILEASNNPDWKVIDINQAHTPENFVKEIHECDCILSSTLHGIIVCDSYGIPAHHISLSNKVIGGDWKFRDYYTSVKRKYKQIDISDLSKLKKQITPYKVKFDFDGYYKYIQTELQHIINLH
jgi:pyruvyltransferase